jgi:hypothetical protein
VQSRREKNCCGRNSMRWCAASLASAVRRLIRRNYNCSCNCRNWWRNRGTYAGRCQPKNAKVRSRKARAPRLPEHLPVVEEVIEPEPVKQKPEDWRCIGQEVSEQLDYEPARFCAAGPSVKNMFTAPSWTRCR